ncbi:MAG: carbamoyl-phosphate synthase large subunit, partial [Planctomycetota bacterium]|nr:carbamoyl-phosphate synthase large subunit [Planctomycetota bacterium]
TGFPIAKFAAKLAVGYTLDEIQNDITRETPACFEPTIDYCVVKIPRFTFEKFPGADPTLTTQMKSVGETMSIGRTFKEALQKAMRGLETGQAGLGLGVPQPEAIPDRDELTALLRVPNAERLPALRQAFRCGMDLDEIHSLTAIDPWFLESVRELVEYENRLPAALGDAHLMREAKQLGYSDKQLALASNQSPAAVRKLRKKLGVLPTYKLVDTCAAEFAAETPYYYSTWEDEGEIRPSSKARIMILGGGPNRIGQGIEFDYCCVHAAFAVQELGLEAVMVNSNPETVSTDYDTSDDLFFEPLTLEDVMNVVEAVEPEGIIVQFGGQTPLNLASGLESEQAPLIGTSVESIDRAEDREQFTAVLESLGLHQPESGMATTVAEAFTIARRIGYPVLVRPSYVLGGRAMEIVFDDESLDTYMSQAVQASPDRPILVDKFLEEAIELDVDAISDGTTVVVGAVMEHIEEAGIHSGDSTCVLPPHTLGPAMLAEIQEATKALARELKVIGLMNIQFAVRGDKLFVIEVNPRASRTVPFVSKAIGVPLAKLAAKIMTGKTLVELGFTEEVDVPYFAVKAPVFPFNRFPGSDILLSPEMRSTGEVMGLDSDLGQAFVKAYEAAGVHLPRRGQVLITVKDADKRAIIPEARALEGLGYDLLATGGTHRALKSNGVRVQRVNKVHEGRPHIVDLIKNREIDLVLNTPYGKQQRVDDSSIRAASVTAAIPCITTRAGISTMVSALTALHRGDYEVHCLQDIQASHLKPRPTPATATAE